MIHFKFFFKVSDTNGLVFPFSALHLHTRYTFNENNFVKRQKYVYICIGFLI